MKVLLANKFFFRNGGSEAVMLMEREFLRRRGVEVIDFAMRDGRNLPSAQQDGFVGTQAYAGQGGRWSKLQTAIKLVHSPEAVRKIGRLIDRTQPDLVHCHNIYHQLTPSIIGAAKRRGVPVVLTLHDYKPVCPVYTRLRDGRPCSDCLDGDFSAVLRHRCADGSRARSALLYAEAVIQRLLGNYERLDAVIAPSRFMAAAVTQARFDRDQVHVLYNGIDTNGIRPAAADGGYALYLGRLSAEKGIETLLQAQRKAGARLPLSIAGTGPLEPSLRATYPDARFLGYLAGPDLERVIREAAVIVVPSEWYENCPISVLEAMAYGKPVVASDIGGIPELVSHGETGLLFPPGDARALGECLIELLADPARRARYGAAARRRAEQEFSLDRHNRGLMNLYARVLGRPAMVEDRPLTDATAMSQE